MSAPASKQRFKKFDKIIQNKVSLPRFSYVKKRNPPNLDLTPSGIKRRGLRRRKAFSLNGEKLWNSYTELPIINTYKHFCHQAKSIICII